MIAASSCSSSCIGSLTLTLSSSGPSTYLQQMEEERLVNKLNPMMDQLKLEKPKYIAFELTAAAVRVIAGLSLQMGIPKQKRSLRSGVCG